MELALFERSIVDTIQRRATLTISLVQKIGQATPSRFPLREVRYEANALGVMEFN
jgi:hypothetical protein